METNEWDCVVVGSHSTVVVVAAAAAAVEEEVVLLEVGVVVRARMDQSND